MKIADAHAHIFPDKLAVKAAASIGEFYGCRMYKPASVENLVAEEARAGVSRCIVSNSAVTPEQVHNINSFIAASCAEHPAFVGFGSIFPGMDGWEAELDRMQALGLRGLKIHSDFQKLPIDEPSAVPMYRSVARRGMIVLFHMGDNRYDFSSPERLTNLIRQVPDLRVVAAHFGGWNAWERSLHHPQPENVLYDTSSTTPLIPRELVLRMFDAFGLERFLFGTDFPMWEPAEMLRQIRTFGLGQEVLDQILYGNFMRLFGLSDS